MGYPQEDHLAGTLAASIGRVLSDPEAGDTIKELAALGDEEGGIAYDPEAIPSFSLKTKTDLLTA